MKCPNCGDPDAYVGLLEVDCPNPACRLYRSSNKKWDKKKSDALTCCGYCHRIGHSIANCPERSA